MAARSSIFAALMLFVLGASAAVAQTSNVVTMHPGETITFTIDPTGGGAFHVLSHGPSEPLSAFEQDILRRGLSGDYGNPVGPNSVSITGSKPLPQVAADVVRVRFIEDADTHQSVLLLENGYDGALNYSAAMYRGNNRGEATDVCQVRPRLRGFENWPYEIAQLDLSNFTLSEWHDGQQPLCH